MRKARAPAVASPPHLFPRLRTVSSSHLGHPLRFVLLLARLSSYLPSPTCTITSMTTPTTTTSTSTRPQRAINDVKGFWISGSLKQVIELSSYSSKSASVLLPRFPSCTEIGIRVLEEPLRPSSHGVSLNLRDEDGQEKDIANDMSDVHVGKSEGWVDRRI
ncbi:hypothetical protein F5888DRAFT_1709337, partial [Russula emetica]